MEEITSVQNQQMRFFRTLKEKKAREESGRFMVEGLKMVGEACACAQVESLIIDTARVNEFTELILTLEQQGKTVYSVSEHVLASISDQKSPQGIAACVLFPKRKPLDGNLLLALDGVQDPGNVGTMLRTADAAGFDGVLLGEGCADAYSPKVLRATMGSIFRVPFAYTQPLAAELAQRRAHGYEVLCSEMNGTPFYQRHITARAVLVIGSESRGVSDEVMNTATQRLKLPMHGGAESLNAAVAAGIMMYEMTKELQ